jgi:hypothetical protein
MVSVKIDSQISILVTYKFWTKYVLASLLYDISKKKKKKKFVI